MQSAPTAERAPGVIVAGMHRSATSLTTSVLVDCGWQPTGRLMGPGRGNRRGHFEDWEIHNLHEAMLKAHGLAWDTAVELRTRIRRRPLQFNDHEPEARKLATRLRQGKPWVWKNPRATLFLEEWGRMFPEAQMVICVRSPAGVVDSLMRRRNPLRVPRNARLRRFQRGARALSLWHSYNLAAYRFAQRHPERTTIVRIPEDLAVLAGAASPSRFDPALIAPKPRFKIWAFTALAPRSQLLYSRLRRMHNPERLAQVLSGPPSAGN